MEKKTDYYWKCEKCKIDETIVDTLDDAWHQAEEHDKEIHNKKPTSHFGWKKTEDK